ncbi:chaplin family protein [Actinocorallia longicatena]|uniref:Chaplin domain-containing protein n=1 Tax=Actinocorallia longicatena TaxID=111803 RepID=A0ABP6QDZ6_9ACTN
MQSWIKFASRAALVAAGFAIMGAGAANADTTSNGAGSILGGNQLTAPVAAPLNVSGNAVSALGKSSAFSVHGSSVNNSRQASDGDDMTTSGKGSILGGNQLYAPINIPINLCGNALAILGTAKAGCVGGAHVVNERKASWGDDDHGMTTSGKGSILGGNQLNVPVNVPINVCGNSAALLGTAKAGCIGGAHVVNERSDDKMKSSGKGSILGGNQAKLPINVPVNLCGNAAAVLGTSKAGCVGSASVTNGTKHWSLPSTQRQAVAKKADHNPLEAVSKILPVPTDTEVNGGQSESDEANPIHKLVQGLPLMVGGGRFLG